MGRLPGFDYRRPFFYMVTLKKLPGIGEFSRVIASDDPPSDNRYLEQTPIHTAFSRIIRSFAGKWRGIAPIECFAIMPDHIHLLLKIEDTPDRLALGKYVYQIEKALAGEYWELRAHGSARAKLSGVAEPAHGSARAKLSRVAEPADGSARAKLSRVAEPAHGSARAKLSGAAEPAHGSARAKLSGAAEPAHGSARAKLSGVAEPADGNALATLRAAQERLLHGASPSAPRPGPPAPIFEREWHDWIVKKDGQLAAFTHYIRENGMRAWRRQRNRRFFTTVRDIDFAGRTWHAYGNAELLDLPVLEPFRCSRSWAEGGPEWSEAIGRAERTGPGGAGVGTFMSACEKACGNAIFKAGGSLVVLTPEGFPPRCHPTRNKEALCAEGRMLFLSLYEPQAGKLDNATLYRRCHEMGDLIRGLGPDGTGRLTGRMVAPVQHSAPDGTDPATLSEAPEEARGKGHE